MSLLLIIFHGVFAMVTEPVEVAPPPAPIAQVQQIDKGK